MKTLLRWLILLYPKPWRTRYGREFDALIGDVGPSWRAAFDVFVGAMKMQLQSLRPWMLVPLCAAIGVASAITFLVMTPSRYASQAVFKIDGDADQVGGVLQDVMSRASLTQIINRENLYRTQRARVPIAELVERMKRDDIEVRPVTEHTFAISFHADDPGTAQRTTQQLATALAQTEGVQLLNPASVPVRPPNPNRWRILFVSFLMGLAAGIVTALFTGLKVWKLATGFGIAGLLLGVIPWYFVDNVWSSSATIAIRSGDPAALQRTIDEVISPARLKVFAKDWAIDETWLRANLHITVFAKGKAILVRYRHKDRYKAQQVTQHFLAQVIDSSARINPGAKLEMLDPASLPLEPFYPNRAMPALLGLLVGIAGAIAQGVRRQRQRLALA